MTRAEIIENIRKKQSYLCIGLDTDLDKIPRHLLRTEDPVYEFNEVNDGIEFEIFVRLSVIL